MAWTTTDFLVDVRRVGQFPTQTPSSLDDASLLLEGDRALQDSLVPLLLRTQEEFLVRRLTQALTAGTGAYPIPRRSVGSRVRDVFYVQSGSRNALPRLRPEQLRDFTTTARGQPRGFYLDAANIILLPAPQAADSLEIAIYVRPGRMVATTSARALTSVSVGTSLTTLGFATYSTFGTTVDVISKDPPFEHKGLDLATASVTTTSLTVPNASLLATPVVGDWIATPDTSPVMQLPVEAHPLLVQRAAASVMQGLGYLEEAIALEKKADRMERDVIDVLTPRTDGSPSRVTGGLLGLINRGRW